MLQVEYSRLSNQHHRSSCSSIGPQRCNLWLGILPYTQWLASLHYICLPFAYWWFRGICWTHVRRSLDNSDSKWLSNGCLRRCAHRRSIDQRVDWPKGLEYPRIEIQGLLGPSTSAFSCDRSKSCGVALSDRRMAAWASCLQRRKEHISVPLGKILPCRLFHWISWVSFNHWCSGRMESGRKWGD